MLRLYDCQASGNGYKVRLLLSQLEIPFERVEVDLAGGQQRQPEFQAKTPFGRVPVLRLEDGSHLAESNAILWYLARGTPLLPASPEAQAQVLQWLFFEQNSLEPHVGGAWFGLTLSGRAEALKDEIQAHQQRARRALNTLERHLGHNRFLVNRVYTIADIALYAYTHLAPAAGLDLQGYPAIRDWFTRVTVEPQHVTMDQGCGMAVTD